MTNTPQASEGQAKTDWLRTRHSFDPDPDAVGHMPNYCLKCGLPENGSMHILAKSECLCSARTNPDCPLHGKSSPSPHSNTDRAGEGAVDERVEEIRAQAKTWRNRGPIENPILDMLETLLTKLDEAQEQTEHFAKLARHHHKEWAETSTQLEAAKQREEEMERQIKAAVTKMSGPSRHWNAEVDDACRGLEDAVDQAISRLNPARTGE